LIGKSSKPLLENPIKGDVMGKTAEILLDPAVRMEFNSAAAGGIVVAELLEPPHKGKARIRIGDNPPIPARCTLDLCKEVSARQWQSGQEVLVAFERGDAERPIIIALMAPVSSAESEAEIEMPSKPEVAEVDGKTVIIRGDEKVELRCGKAGILIRKDGKIIIRGAHLLSRSSGPIRLKGGHVDIN
jgi:hypothetical protein